MLKNRRTGESSGWWARWFNEEYLHVYQHRDVPSAESEARAAIDWLGLQPNDSVLDLCCGTGRHLSWLLAHGVCRAVGLDFSVPMLQQARTELGPDVDLVRGDMRFLPFSACFDAVLVFFTSFGYFSTDEETERVIRQIAQILRPGGGFVFDYLDHKRLTKDLEPETVRTAGGADIRETRRIVDNGKRVHKEIFITREGEIHRYEESVRLYTLRDLRAMFESVGLIPEQCYGDFNGSPRTEDSNRLILVRSPRR
ncbi:MAG: class I SAM-dependent methyltransferase [bacterium]